MESAEEGKFFPAPQDPADPLKLLHCKLDGEGAAVVKSLPTDDPCFVSYSSESWKKLPAFREFLAKAEHAQGWPERANRAWKEYLAHPDCSLRSVVWDLAALRAAPPPPPPLPAPAAAVDDRTLAVDPLITSTRSKTKKAEEEAAAGCVSAAPPNFDMPFSELEEGDFVFALAQPGALHAFTQRVGGKTSAPVELLQIVNLSAPGGPKKARLLLTLAALVLILRAQATYRYYQPIQRNGVYKFEEVVKGGAVLEMEHAYVEPGQGRSTEILMVWHHTDDELEAQLRQGVYELHNEQLRDLQLVCAPDGGAHTLALTPTQSAASSTCA
jgi:hypothetical protein